MTLNKPMEDTGSESMHHGGSFKKYMEFKQKKLREQYQDERGDTDRVSKLFAGISIHVNGFTNPTHQVSIYLEVCSLQPHTFKFVL